MSGHPDILAPDDVRPLQSPTPRADTLISRRPGLTWTRARRRLRAQWHPVSSVTRTPGVVRHERAVGGCPAAIGRVDAPAVVPAGRE
ncbi:MAG TPA: hypothetical protein VI248_18880 [Kineosporiaceae bacterium]